MVEQLLNEKISELREKISDLKKRWPAHSLKPAMMEELEQLEDELAELMQQKDARLPHLVKGEK